MDIVLALGGGGAKGNAHLGVIKVLENAGYRIQGVAGTSAGGMVSAVYAAGFRPDEIIEIFSSVDQKDLYSLGGGPALLGMEGISKALNQFLDRETFQDLEVPCALTAVDLKEMREVVLSEGSVKNAVLATIAIPGIFPPRKWGDHLLIDGGVVDPVPVTVARELRPDLPVVAVSLSTLSPQQIKYLPGALLRNPPILKPIAKLRVAQAFDIFMRSVILSQHMLAEKRLELEKPDYIIRPQVAHIGYLDRVNVREVAALGEEAARAALPELKKQVGWRRRIKDIFS
jgi:NTE family protein